MLSANQVAGLVQNKLMKQSHFLHIDTNLQKFYIDLKFFWFGMVKNECDQSGLGVLRLTVSEKRTWKKLIFLQVGTNSMIFGWTWSKIAVAF